jgi:hypothetical protein
MDTFSCLPTFPFATVQVLNFASNKTAKAAKSTLLTPCNVKGVFLPSDFDLRLTIVPHGSAAFYVDRVQFLVKSSGRT